MMRRIVINFFLVFMLQGDADIFFPTDFWLLERFDHYCSGWLETCQKNPSKEKKKRRTFTVSSTSDFIALAIKFISCGLISKVSLFLFL